MSTPTALTPAVSYGWGPSEAEGDGGFSWMCHQPLAGSGCLTSQAVEQSRALEGHLSQPRHWSAGSPECWQVPRGLAG